MSNPPTLPPHGTSDPPTPARPRSSGAWWVLALVACPPVAWVTAFVVARTVDGAGSLLAWLVGVPLAAGALILLLARRRHDRARLAGASIFVTAAVPALLYVLFFVVLSALIN